MVVFVFSSENGIIKTNDKNERGKINKNTELGRRRKKLCKKKEEKILFITLAKEKKQSSKTNLACEINRKKQKTICKHINGSNNVDKYTKGLTKRKTKQTNKQKRFRLPLLRSVRHRSAVVDLPKTTHESKMLKMQNL